MPSARLRKKVRHVGCGPRTVSPLDPAFCGEEREEIGLDIDPGAEPDIVASIADMSMVSSDSIDALYSSHNLEPRHARGLPLTLRGLPRVLDRPAPGPAAEAEGPTPVGR